MIRMWFGLEIDVVGLPPLRGLSSITAKTPTIYSVGANQKLSLGWDVGIYKSDGWTRSYNSSTSHT